LSYGVYIDNDASGNPTKIMCMQKGIYNIQFAAQFRHTGGGSPNVDIWLKKNGNDVEYTNTRVKLQGSDDYLLASWNYFQKIETSTDYIQIYWYSVDNGVTIYSENITLTPTRPKIPSVILTVNQIN
jgi:hypothetical protein